MRFLIGAFGDPGHAFPAIALGRELVARGNDVLIQTWKKWEQHCLDERLQFAAAPEYHVFPTRNRPLKPYQAVVRAASDTRPLVVDFNPDVVVNDILTLAPALAAELEGRRRATLVPHVFPPAAPGVPPFGLGAMPPRSSLGRAAWRALSRPAKLGVNRGGRELNETRRRLGLDPTPHSYGGMSRELTVVGTFPQLEYPRQWPGHVELCGPLVWEPPSEPIEPPPGNAPLVLVAPSTSQDPEQHLLAATVRGLRGLPVRVLATYNRRPPPTPIDVPANTKLVDWLSYARAMPLADIVVCHGGHGTMTRALICGKPVLVCPAAGDMAENGVRAQWAGAGLCLPMRLTNATTVRWAVQRLLERPSYARRARELGEWAQKNDGAATAADALGRQFSSSASSRNAGAASRV